MLFKYLFILPSFIFTLNLNSVLTFRNEIDSDLAEFIIEENTNRGIVNIEAFKSSINDQILKNQDFNQYDQLRWYSMGNPELFLFDEYTKYFKFDTLGFYSYIQMLTDKHKISFTKLIKNKYEIDVDISQIRNLIPSKLECSLKLNYEDIFTDTFINLIGKVKSLNLFPLKLQFLANYDSKERILFKNFLKNNSLVNFEPNFDCNVTFEGEKKLEIVRTFSFSITNSTEMPDFTLKEDNKSNDQLEDRFNKIKDELGEIRMKLDEIVKNKENETFFQKIDSIESMTSDLSLRMENLEEENTKKINKNEFETLRIERIIFNFNLSKIEKIFSLSILPNGDLASGTSDGVIKIFDVKDGSLRKILNSHKNYTWKLLVLPNGDLASASLDQTIIIWETKDGKVKKTLNGHSDRVYSLTFLPNGNLVSGSADKSIIIWNLNNGTIIRRLNNHTENVYQLATSLEGLLVSGSFDDTIIIWNRDYETINKTLRGHSSDVTCLYFLSNGNLVSGSFGEILIWDIYKGIVIENLIGHTNWVLSFIELPNRYLISSSSDQKIIMWDIDNKKIKNIINQHTDWVRSLVVYNSTSIVSGSQDGTIIFWNIH